MELDPAKIKLSSVILLGAVIFGVAIPGYLLLYEVNPTLFLTLDLFRVTILALGMSTSFYMINLTTLLLNGWIIDKSLLEFRKLIYGSIPFAALISCIIIYTLVIFKHFAHVSFGWLLLIGTAIQVAILIWSIRDTLKSKREKATAQQQDAQ